MFSELGLSSITDYYNYRLTGRVSTTLVSFYSKQNQERWIPLFSLPEEEEKAEANEGRGGSGAGGDWWEATVAMNGED